MKIIFTTWLVILSIIITALMFNIMKWAVKVNQEAIIQNLQFDLKSIESDPDYATGKLPKGY